MKSIRLSVAIGTLVLLSVTAGKAAFAPTGPITFKLSVAGQNQTFEQISLKTKISATITNTIRINKSSTTNAAFGNDIILRLLENSFNTNFPVGTKLACRGSQILVLNPGGGILLDVSGVFFFAPGTTLTSGLQTLITTQDSTGTHFSGNETEDFLGLNDLVYDDTAQTTANGQHINVVLHGVMDLKRSLNIKTGEIKSSFIFNGSGGGTVDDHFVILQGSASGKASGTPP